MTTQTELRLSTFADWVQATHEHASFRLPLLKRAEKLLAGQEQVPADDKRRLAAKLERWRYQLFREKGGRLALEDRRLADALDLAANDLAGRGLRPPRSPRTAICDGSSDTRPITQAKAFLKNRVRLDRVVCRAAELTREHFAHSATSDDPASARWRMLLYAPLYVSSHCINHCLYCGFRFPERTERRHLSCEEALHEAEILRDRGFRHVLLVAGDFPRLTTPEYYAEIIGELTARGMEPAVEIAPQTTDAYAELVAAGACGVTLYQETYDEARYAEHHPRGSKASFDWRLEGLERAAEAGMQRLGLGILLGLADPKEDLLTMMRHARYLEARFPDRTLAFSLPRIHEAPQAFTAPYLVGDETFIRLYCVLRTAFPRAELVLSTREPAALRNRLAEICITQMSAGSCTVPGGYREPDPGSTVGEQFPVCDHRCPAEVSRWLSERGFSPTWSVRPCKRDRPR
ncbi:MAG: radical SAM protein [Planctomycetota bacterium]|jgi:2-iminoacetate synthase